MNQIHSFYHALPQVFSDLPEWLSKPFDQLDKCDLIRPLVDRVTSNWKATIMDTATVIAAVGVAFTFFTGAVIPCIFFGILTGAALFGSFYMRRFTEIDLLQTAITDLKNTNTGLNQTVTNFRGTVSSLEIENRRLGENCLSLRSSSEALERNSQTLRTNVRDLEASNRVLESGNQELQINIRNSESTNQELGREVQSLRTEIGRANDSNALLTEQISKLTSLHSLRADTIEQLKNQIDRLQDENVLLKEGANEFKQSLQLLDGELVNYLKSSQQFGARIELFKEITARLAATSGNLSESVNSPQVVELIEVLKDMNQRIENYYLRHEQTGIWVRKLKR